MPRLLIALLVAASALAAGRDLAPRPYGPSAYQAHGPLVAYAGGKYLTVWLESLDRAGWRYLGALSDSAGKRLSPSAFVVVPYGIAGPAQLIGTGDGFALFFPHDSGVQMMDIDLSGRVTATRVVPVDGFLHDPSVAWDGTHFVALARTSERSRAMYFDRFGAIRRTVDLPCLFVKHELFAVRTDTIVAGSCDGSLLRADRIAQDGSITTTTLDLLLGARFVFVAAPAPGGGTLFAWSSPDQNESLKTILISESGAASEPRTVVQDGLPLPLVPLGLVPRSNAFLLPYTKHGNLRVATLSEDGALLEPAEDQPPSPGFNVAAATDGKNVFVADNPYVPQPSPGSIRTRLATSANITAPEFVSIVPARQQQPILGAGSGELVAAWTEVAGSAHTVKAARIAPDGTPLASATIASNAALVTSDLAWNGAQYLTVIAQGGKLRAQRITAFGEPAAEPATVLGDAPTFGAARAAVVWADTLWLVAWTDLSDKFLAEVRPDGTVTARWPITLEGPVPIEMDPTLSVREVAIAFDGKSAIVAWIEARAPQNCRVTCLHYLPAFVVAVRSDGSIANIPMPIGEEEDRFASLSLAMHDRNLVVVANREYGPAHAVSIEHAGIALKRVASRDFEGLADVTWDGSAFVLALREREELTIRRVDATLRDAGRARVVRIAPADVESTPAIAAAISGNAIAGVQECDAEGGRAVVYAEQELAFEPPRRRSVRK